MATFGDLQTKVSKKLIDANNTAIALSDVADALNDALHFWKYRRFWFNERQTTVTMDINDPFVFTFGQSNGNYPAAPVLPQLFLYEVPDDGFTVYYNQQRYTMKKRHPKVFDQECVGDITGGTGSGLGLPYIYTFRNQAYEFYFYPNLQYSLVVNYITDYADLVNAADANDFTTYADRLLTYEALSRVIGEQRQDLQMADSYAAKAEREYQNLQLRGNQQTASGELTFESIL